MARETHYRACNLCEAICGIKIELEGGEIVSIKGDDADPLSRGHICPKAIALKDFYEDPDRLRQPMIREGDQWREAEWDEALAVAARGLTELQLKQGDDAVGIYIGNPAVHNYGALTHGKYLMGPLGTRNRFSATSVDQLPHQLVALWMYGHQLMVPIPDIDNTDYFLMLGANPIASNGSLMTVPDVRKRIKALQARGGKLVLLDPRRTETAAVADQHLFVSPGTDVFFLLALLNTLLADGAARTSHLDALLDGIDGLSGLVEGFTPEAVAARVGIGADVIRQIAADFAAADKAVVYGRMGVSTQQYGTLCQWLMQVINIVTGNLDRVGGAMFTQPAYDIIGAPRSNRGSFGRTHSRVRGLPEFNGEYPAASMAEEMQTPGEGQIRGMVTIAGNPVLSTPNGRKLDEAFESLEFMVSVDPYLNETTRHADVILPPVSPLEKDHYDIIFHVFAVRNTARYSKPLFEKPDGAKADWEILTELGQRICDAKGLSAREARPPHAQIKMGIDAGPYGPDGQGPDAGKLSFDELADAPHGIDLGPMRPCLTDRLRTADGRINCVPEPVLADLERARADFEAAAGTGLSLIGRRHVRSNNSWMHNYHRLVKGPQREALLMHPKDMDARGISDGDQVKVRSRVGEVEVRVEASDDVMPGVVSLPHGWGHDRKGIRMAIAQDHAGVSANDLTDEQFLDELSGNAAVNGVPVEVIAA